MTQKAFLESFESGKYVCPTCHRLCHVHIRDPVKYANREKAAEILKTHGLEKLNRILVGTGYKVESILDESSAREREEKCKADWIHATKFSLDDFTHSGHIPFAQRWESTGGQRTVRTKRIKEEVVVSSYTTTCDEPIYETDYRTESYKEPIREKVAVTKSRKVVKPYTKRINKPMINTWVTPNRWEDRWYTEYYEDISYENYTVYEDQTKYVTKTRRVPFQKQVGTRKVEKIVPIKETREREVSYIADTYITKTRYYYLVPLNEPCSKCQCSKCLGIWVSTWRWLSELCC